MNFAKSLRISILQTSTRTLKNKISTSVSFRKILGFTINGNQVFYYEGTSS